MPFPILAAEFPKTSTGDAKNADQTVERLLASPHKTLIKALLSRDVNKLRLSGFDLYGFKTGSTSSHVCHVQKSWCADETCAAVLFGSVIVVNVYALDSAKSFKKYEKFMQVVNKAMTEGLRKRAKRFFVASDLNVDLGFLCIDEDDEGLYEAHVAADPGCLKKAMWCETLTGVHLAELRRPEGQSLCAHSLWTNVL